MSYDFVLGFFLRFRDFFFGSIVFFCSPFCFHIRSLKFCHVVDICFLLDALCDFSFVKILRSFDCGGSVIFSAVWPLQYLQYLAVRVLILGLCGNFYWTCVFPLRFSTLLLFLVSLAPSLGGWPGRGFLLVPLFLLPLQGGLVDVESGPWTNGFFSLLAPFFPPFAPPFPPRRGRPPLLPSVFLSLSLSLSLSFPFLSLSLSICFLFFFFLSLWCNGPELPLGSLKVPLVALSICLSIYLTLGGGREFIRYFW